MSRPGRDGDRKHSGSLVREPVDYVALAKQSRTIEQYETELAERNVTAETQKPWKKAMTAWRAVEASRHRTARDRAPREPAAASQELDYTDLARQFRHRHQYERHLVRELGLKPGTTSWEKASSAYDLKEHLEGQQRRPDRAPRRDADDRRAIERAEDRLIQVARECRTREEFDRYLREELHYEPGSVKYETAMLAWAVFKRETEGF
jgi:hypothetical protein